MQEETTQKTVALIIRAGKLTSDVLVKAMRLYLRHQKKSTEQHRGKITLKKLMEQDAGAGTIEISGKTIKTFERVAKRYHIDFAVRKNKSGDIPKYLVFFKGKDKDVIEQAFREYVAVNERNKKRISLKSRLRTYQKYISQEMTKSREKEKHLKREDR